MQNIMPDNHYLLFRRMVIFTLIASILICIACNVSDSNRFYFVTQSEGVASLSTQYVDASTSFHFDFAGEETLRGVSSSYSNFNHSMVRSLRSSSHSFDMLVVVLMAAILFLLNNLCSYAYGYQVLLKKNFSSIRIAGFIEQSDGKK